MSLVQHNSYYFTAFKIIIFLGTEVRHCYFVKYSCSLGTWIISMKNVNINSCRLGNNFDLFAFVLVLI